jgi:hypothetical protein
VRSTVQRRSALRGAGLGRRPLELTAR